ncbi:4-methylaminobutanoate oxidase (formaldehyde-forming) [Roseovarius nanhaiticus]|uniref:4-methylaminobutanoate oxidase (Formaldehyde-forming) n=1 Tax=Roseovarius nanhaiticus TaxID=573024 RepID=A0A1N7GAG9_9RHOB|nr:FAD-dependent oxidoreductase [Roseovarius nanhaiticus]SEK32607.1 4-methylaminobutanoate oxidase (formaldehyde-forming) [Roseovarius nanhaiticus]SIS09585.1 4-methylaminobutanoate oxidase (formaldehyde-forming) [Roseovarius nanhaiticus]
MSDFPKEARAVIVGGGIIGCSTAYHLADLGWDVVLLERKKLTSGTTFHAAGLVGQLRSNANITQLLGYSVDLYKRLEAETGQATGWKMNGGLRLACNEERWTEVKRQATTAHSFGLEMELLTPSEAQKLWPLMQVDDVIGAAYLPTDGQANPSDITLSLAKGARQKGARIFEDTKVTEVIVEDGVIKGVETEKGRIDTPIIIACCGQWTRAFAKTVGVNVPLVPVEHQYMVTEPIDGVTADMPTLRDPDRLTYYKEEVGGLVMGGYEANPILWARNGIPKDFHYTLLDSNFDHFEQLMELSLGRVPALETAGIKTLTNGPESFTPDGNFILGEAPELRNFFVGAGFNAYGIAAGGGAGMALAEWVAKGQPPYDLWAVDIRRFGRPHFDDDWIRARTYEAYGKHYTMAWPSEEQTSARPCRKSPLYDVLKSQGAVFGEKLGWERPNWFAEPGEEARDIYTFGVPNWHDAVAREHRAAREAAVLIDQTSFAKFVLKGPDAEAALGWIAANDVRGPVGKLTYTQMLNDHGGIECDLTCLRAAQDEFYIVTGTGYATHDFDHIARTIPEGMNAQLVDVTSSYAVLSLMGPKARDILQAVTHADVSNAAFPFGTGQTIGIAGAPVRALRVTYVGELGWELHIPTEYATAVHAKLVEAGAPHGLRNAGYRAIETLRLEKGYRAWASDIGPDHTPFEAGLGWAVKLKTNVDFRGREACAAQKENGVRKIMATFTAAPDVILSGRETILNDGKRCGWLSSAGYGHTIGAPIGMGYVRSDSVITHKDVLAGSYELEVAGVRVPAKVHLTPLVDPKMENVKV